MLTSPHYPAQVGPLDPGVSSHASLLHHHHRRRRLQLAPRCPLKALSILVLHRERSREKTFILRRMEHNDPRFRLQALSEMNLSRPPSPRHQQERNQWLSSLGKEDKHTSAICDSVIIDEFLWLFEDRVANWFSCFRHLKFTITPNTRREWYLEMAAVGALYCPTEGSIKVAK